MPTRARLFVNGTIRPYAHGREKEAMAVLEGRVLYVGDKDVAKDSFPRGIVPEEIDLGGKPVLPGFIDSHMHLLNLGLALGHLQLLDVKSISEIKTMLSEKAQKVAPGEWILGRGWDQDLFAEKRYPTRRDLDEASGGRPVHLTRACGHIGVVSSKALEIAGITKDTADPPGGKIDRDQYGDPTGILRESAQHLVADKIPAPTQETLLEATKEAMRYMLARGITTIHPNDGQGGFPGTMELYRKSQASGLPLRVYWDIPVAYMDEVAAQPLRTRDGDDYFRIGAIKMFADGSLGGHTAALEAPYSDQPGNSGILVISEDDLQKDVYTAHALGMQVAIHVIGDRAARVGLEAIDRAQSKLPRKALRHRLVHTQILSPQLITEMRRTRIVAEVQPKFLTTDLRWAQDRVGAQRMRSSYAWRTMLRAGIPLAGGSDCPVEPADPLYGIYAAVNRTDMEGNPRGGYFPNERVTLEEAIRMFTEGGAFAAFQEDDKGTLECGKLADFVVLSEDLFNVSTDEIKDVEILTTVVGGEVAYQKA